MKVQRSRYLDALEAENRGDPPSKILELLQLAAAEGSADAQYAIASLYLNGKYVDIDEEKGVGFLMQASLGMVPSALYDLAIAYEKGVSVDKDEKQAFELYFKSMVLGDRDALREVARCFFHGIGIRKSKRLYDLLLEISDHLKSKNEGSS